MQAPDIAVEDKVLEDEPGDMEDDEEGEGGDAASLHVQASWVNQSSGQVHQAGEKGANVNVIDVTKRSQC